MKSSANRQTNVTPPPREQSSQVSPELRIDSPHETNTESAHSALLEEDQGVDLTAADLEKLPDWQRRQINQLARLLRDRQVDLDRREAELNARLANFESQQRSAALAYTEQFAAAPTTEPAASSAATPANPLRTIEEKIRSWRRKWRGEAAEASAEPPINDGITVRLEKLAEAEAQLAQQWALLKNARSLQELREKEFTDYAQKVEREREQSHFQQRNWLEQEQEQLARQLEEVERREAAQAGVQQELELAFAELQVIRDHLELAWAEIRVRIPSALRRRLDQQTNQTVDHFDKALQARQQSSKLEIRHLLHQLELAKLEIQEQHVQLEDDTQRQFNELRRAKRELADRETLVRAQLAKLHREQETLNETKLDLLKQRYQELSQTIIPKAA